MITKLYGLVYDIMQFLGSEWAVNKLLDTWYVVLGIGLAAIITALGLKMMFKLIL